jgi:hypothetical protein
MKPAPGSARHPRTVQARTGVVDVSMIAHARPNTPRSSRPSAEIARPWGNRPQVAAEPLEQGAFGDQLVDQVAADRA